MFEKVSPSHPDKIADRIAGAIVDLAYTKNKNPKVAVEVLLGHGKATVMIESSEDFRPVEIVPIVRRLAGDVELDLHAVKQDPHLANNQEGAVRCGDNGCFKGSAPTYEQKALTAIAASIYEAFPYDGKYLIGRFDFQNFIRPSDGGKGSKAVTICQSHATEDEIAELWNKFWENHGAKAVPRRPNRPGIDNCYRHDTYGAFSVKINPLGEWTGGINVDCGATNRKLGSDLGDGVSGGGINGKDLSKGDVSINIVCFLKAVQSGQTVTACCSIGDEHVTFQYADGKTETETFADVVEMARLYILTDCGGGFEKFAEWGLVRPLAQV